MLEDVVLDRAIIVSAKRINHLTETDLRRRFVEEFVHVHREFPENKET